MAHGSPTALSWLQFFIGVHALLQVASAAADCENRTLKLLVSLPLPNALPQFHPSWAEGPNILPAMLLAMDQINNRTDLLPCHRLELIPVDGGCEIVATTAVNTAIGLFNGTGIIGMIGPGCSTSSLHTAHLLNQPSIELVHVHGGGSYLLEDRDNFPNSIGILGSTRSFVHLSVALIKESGWKNLAILYESSRVYYRSTKELFVESLEKSGVNVLFDSPVYPTFYPLDDVKSSLARIVFLFTAPSHSLKIMCLAHHLGMIYPGYQWIIVSRRLDDFVSEVALLSDNGNFSYKYGQRTYNCSLGTLLNVSLNQSFLLSYKLMPLNKDQVRHANITFNQFIDLYTERVMADNVSQTYWAHQFYDAVWAWARVLHRININHNRPFDDLQYGNKTLVNIILDEFYDESFDFEGMSGSISFNSSTGYTDRPSILNQIFSGEEVLVAYSNGTEIVPLDGRPNTIPDTFRPVESNVSTALVAIFASFLFLCFFIVGFLHILTVVYRDSKSVKASSPKLNHFAFIGVYLLILGLLLFLFLEIRDNNEADGPICHVAWAWLLPMSFTLSVGTVVVRTWRLYRIFNHYLNPGKFISNSALIATLMILLSIDVIIAVIWTATDQRKILHSKRTVANGDAIEIIINTKCRSEKYETLWVSLVYLYKLSLLVVMVILTLLTRRIPNRTFATTSLRVFSYTFSGVFGIGLTLYYFLLYFVQTGDSNLRYTVLYTSVTLTILLYVLFVFMPPLAPVLHGKFSDRKFEFSRSVNFLRTQDDF